MPLTRLLNSAIDGVAHTMAETRADILRYAGSDLLCYRAEEPEDAGSASGPMRSTRCSAAPAEFAERALQCRGRSDACRAAALSRWRRSALALDADDDPIALAALSAMTTLTGSALLALAVARGFLSPKDAWRAAHVDEDFQAERWGADSEAVARLRGPLARDGGRGGRR